MDKNLKFYQIAKDLLCLDSTAKHGNARLAQTPLHQETELNNISSVNAQILPPSHINTPFVP